MVLRAGLKRHFSRGLAVVWLLAAAGVAGTVISAGCGKVSSTPVDPGAVDTGSLSLKIAPAAESVPPGLSVEIAVTVTDASGLPVKDGTMISLTGDAMGNVVPTSAPTTNGTARATFQAGTTPGTSTIQASTSGISQTITVQIDPGAAAPPPISPGGGTEPIDLTKVIWVHARGENIAAWPVTAKLGAVTIEAPYNVCSTGMSWPSTWTKNGSRGVSASHVVLGFINGQWYGGAWESMNAGISSCRPMETMMKKENLGPFGQVEQVPFWDWYPKKGEQIGFLVTSWIREGVQQPVGRSNVVMTTWPW